MNKVIALSGGSDSAYLLHVVVTELIKDKNELTAIYVNHHTPQSKAFIKACKELTDMYEVNFVVKDIRDNPQRISDLGLEGYWREERYRLLLEDNPEVLYTGHHLYDNTESVLLHMFRGTGVKGMIGINSQSHRSNTKVIRPLLRLSKMDILEKVKELKLTYVEDQSNTDIGYKRNYIRLFIDQMRVKFNSLDDNILRLSETMSDLDKCVNDLNELDLEYCKGNKLNNGDTRIDTERFSTLPSYRQTSLIKYLTKNVYLSKNNIETVVEMINKKHTDKTCKFVTKNMLISSNSNITTIKFKQRGI